MKTLIATQETLSTAGRWDIDFHLPAELIREYPEKCCIPVRDVADVIKAKRDPTKKPEQTFWYIDISSINVVTGKIESPQQLKGKDAPSRARKVVHAYDIIISTCRPTRRAIAVVPELLHGEICSTGFSVIRCKNKINPFYLHFALRLASTMEQFRKWSTGSSYPAILDEDVEKTIVPIPPPEVQDRIAEIVRKATAKREALIIKTNKNWESSLEKIVSSLKENEEKFDRIVYEDERLVTQLVDIKTRLESLPPVEEEVNTSELEVLLFNEEDIE